MARRHRIADPRGGGVRDVRVIVPRRPEFPRHQTAATAEHSRSFATGETGTQRAPDGFQGVAPFEAQRADDFEEKPMRKMMMAIAAVAALGIAEPAAAYDTGGVISMQAALGVATDLGLATISHTEFAGDEWQFQGRDRSGRWMEVYVDAATGDVRGVNRGW
jgi:hypothetical protein